MSPSGACAPGARDNDNRYDRGIKIHSLGYIISL